MLILLAQARFRKWAAIPLWLSATDNSLILHVSSVSGGRIVASGQAMTWRQGTHLQWPPLLLFIIFSGSAAQCWLWSPVALQPSAGYGLLWLYSPVLAMVSCGSAAQRGLGPPVALQPSAGYDLLWLCSPVRAMASCGSAAQRGLRPPRSRGFVITHNDAPQSVGLLWTSDQFVTETSTWQHTQQTNIHAPGEIQTHDRNRRAAVDLRLKSRGHWDRQNGLFIVSK
jgi:hypothetical protein